MIGKDPPVMVMDPPNLFPSTLTLPVEMAGFVSTDGVRSSEFYPTVSLQKCLTLIFWGLYDLLLLLVTISVSVA